MRTLRRGSIKSSGTGAFQSGGHELSLARNILGSLTGSISVVRVTAAGFTRNSSGSLPLHLVEVKKMRRVYYNKQGQVTGYSDRGWSRFMVAFWITIFLTAILGWPLAVVDGWMRWLAEVLWLLALLAVWAVLGHRKSRGRHTGPGHEDSVRSRPGEGQTTCRPGPGDTVPYGPLYGQGPRDWTTL